MPKKYYAVKKGRKTGIYTDWDDCRREVEGFSGAVYKSFPTKEAAEIFLTGEQKTAESSKETCSDEMNGEPRNYAFVDGSFHSGKKIYGYGGFLVHDGQREILQGSGTDGEMASMRNVAGEILGSMAAIEQALALGLKELTIYYDYMGIEMWATGDWKRNKKGTIAYYEYVQSAKKEIALSFVKVKGHSGVAGNEEADRLAKEAVGLL